MKKLIVLAVFFLFSGVLAAQNLKKGTLVGTHVLKVELKEDVTMEEWQNYYVENVLPEIKKNLKGWDAYLMKGIRGVNEDELGILYIVSSEKDRDKYYNDDGTMNEAGLKLTKNMQSVFDELDKLGTSTTTYTDWIVIK